MFGPSEGTVWGGSRSLARPTRPAGGGRHRSAPGPPPGPSGADGVPWRVHSRPRLTGARPETRVKCLPFRLPSPSAPACRHPPPVSLLDGAPAWRSWEAAGSSAGSPRLRTVARQALVRRRASSGARARAHRRRGTRARRRLSRRPVRRGAASEARGGAGRAPSALAGVDRPPTAPPPSPLGPRERRGLPPQ